MWNNEKVRGLGANTIAPTTIGQQQKQAHTLFQIPIYSCAHRETVLFINIESHVRHCDCRVKKHPEMG